ncbi:MAG: amidohydrolase family protein [Planctomycetaceae bacterium]|nr:amidohydrolase family protein [Planctomycetaceae bacterium]
MIVDVNVHLSRWPFRRLACDELPRLIEKLQAGGVDQAWAASFDAVFHKDVAAVNSRLAADCRKTRPGMLLPFGTVNPTLPDWREDVRRCHEEHKMPGVRLYPGYHGYALDAPELAELLTMAEERGLVVQVVVRLEDTRMQHPLMRVEDVDPKPLAELVAARPKLRVVVLNALKGVRAGVLAALVAAGQVYFEISMLEGVEGIANLLGQVPAERLLFGSHLPMFVLESALLKLQESELTAAQIEAITHGNAERLLNG